MINESSLGEFVKTPENLSPETRHEVITRIVRKIEKSNSEKQKNSLGKLIYEFRKPVPTFNLEEELKNMAAPIVEVGGPTNSGFYQEPLYQDRNKLLVTNITPGQPVHEFDEESKSMNLVGYEGEVDKIMDATKMDLEDKSIGALYAASLPLAIRDAFLSEAKRVLDYDGLLIVEGVGDRELDWLEKNGFKLLEEMVMKVIGSDESKRDAVFKLVRS